jgi:hypothetical protein
VLALVEAVVRGEEDVSVLQLAGVVQRAHHVLHQVVDRLQGLDPPFVAVVYFGDPGSGEPGKLPDPGRFVGDVPLVEGREARSHHVVERMLVAGSRGGRRVGSDGGDVGEEGLNLGALFRINVPASLLNTSVI